MRIPGERFLHAPGPTHVPAEVLNAMHRQPMDHADPRLDAVIANCESGLKRLLRISAAEIFLYIANGHGVWEATTENLLAPGEAALLSSTGHFSESWARQLEDTGRRAIRTPYRAGYPVDPADVEKALREGIDVAALRTVARERFQVAFAGGLGPFEGNALRIGHLGDLNSAMILGCLAGVEAAMLAQGIPFGRDGVARAVACIAGAQR